MSFLIACILLILIFHQNSYFQACRFLLYLLQQIPTIVLGIGGYAVNAFANHQGKQLWKVIQQTNHDLQSSIGSVPELVGQMQLLSQIYVIIEDYHERKRRLEALVNALLTVTRGSVLRDVLQTFEGREGERTEVAADVGGADDEPVSTAAQPGISTKLTVFLLKQADEALGRLETATDVALVDANRAIIPFQHIVQDDIMTVNARLFAITAEMDAVAPSPDLATDRSPDRS